MKRKIDENEENMRTIKRAKYDIEISQLECIDENSPIIPWEMIFKIASYFPRNWILVSRSCFATSFPILLDDPRIDPAYNNDEPLIRACKFGFLRTAQLLVRDPRVDLAANGYEALMECMMADHFHVFQLMLNKVTLDSQQFYKLIKRGIACGKYHFVTYAIKQKQTIIEESFYQLWLTKAIKYSQYHLVKKLMKHVTPNYKIVAFAAEFERYHILKLLLKKWPNITEFHTNGEIFHPSVVFGQYHCVKLLLKSGLSPELPERYKDKKPTWFAAKHCRWEVLKLLLDYKKNKDQETLDYEALLKLMTVPNK